MCGLCGFIPRSETSSDHLEASLRRMADSLEHRGPDDDGYYIDPAVPLGLGFRRLAIQDLLRRRASADGLGEPALCHRLQRRNIQFPRAAGRAGSLPDPPAWRGHSDTEVILALVDRIGIEATVQRLSGMFAFALWDKSERVLWLRRDRLGKKPLYYSLTRSGFVFASELKALLQVVRGELSVSPESLNSFIRLSYIPGRSTIYRQCSKLPAGHLLRIDVAQLGKSDQPPDSIAYWSMEQVALEGQRQARAGHFATQQDFEDQLDVAVSQRMVADVELGAFLSGGLDSSLVVARMAALGSRTPRTFSIAFEDARWNEAPYARAIAQARHTEHTEFTVTPQDSLSVIPQLASTFDEPFADASMIPTLIVSRMARKHVTVALSGDRGDEFFGGYDRYFIATRVDRWTSKIPSAARPALAGLLGLTLPVASALDVNARVMRRRARRNDS